MEEWKKYIMYLFYRFVLPRLLTASFMEFHFQLGHKQWFKSIFGTAVSESQSDKCWISNFDVVRWLCYVSYCVIFAAIIYILKVVYFLFSLIQNSWWPGALWTTKTIFDRSFKTYCSIYESVCLQINIWWINR